MKKVIFSLIFSMGLGFIAAEESNFSFSIGAGIRNVVGVEDKNGKNLYTEVYKKYNIAYSIDFGCRLSKSLRLFLHSDYFSADGKLTFTGEDTDLTIIPVELGIRFFMGKTKIFPYIGGGIGYYFYREENVIDTVEDKKFGFFCEGGLKFQSTKLLFIDLKFKYTFLKVDGFEGQVVLGGLGIIGGIGISF